MVEWPTLVRALITPNPFRTSVLERMAQEKPRHPLVFLSSRTHSLDQPSWRVFSGMGCNAADRTPVVYGISAHFVARLVAI